MIKYATEREKSKTAVLKWHPESTHIPRWMNYNKESHNKTWEKGLQDVEQQMDILTLIQKTP